MECVRAAAQISAEKIKAAHGVACRDRARWQPDRFRRIARARFPAQCRTVILRLAASLWTTLACAAEQPGAQAATNRAFAFDLAANIPAWRALPPLPGQPRILAAAAAHDGVFYVFGGAALVPDAAGNMARVYLREAWSFRAAQGWHRLADLPKPAVAAPSPAPFLDGKLLLLAGDDGSRAGFTPVEKHPGFPRGILACDPAPGRWSEAGDLPAPRRQRGAARERQPVQRPVPSAADAVVRGDELI